MQDRAAGVVGAQAEGAAAPNARSISASHAFMQATGANQEGGRAGMEKCLCWRKVVWEVI